MRLDIRKGEGPSPRQDPVTAVVFDPNTTDVVAACDDQTLIHFDSEGEQLSETPNGAHIMALSWLPSPGKASTNTIAAACSDGFLLLTKKSGVIEKKVRAHEGAAICVEWNSDGSSLASAGEDGEVKIWSRTGNLRTRLAAYKHPVNDISWGPDDNALVVANRNRLCILQTQGRGKTIQWEAHLKEHGLVLSLDWNCVTDRIVCGGEDCCFRIFDTFGLPLFVSSPQGNVVSSVAWSPNGETFAVGSFETVNFCDGRGWGYSQHSLTGAGSILDMKFNHDGTRLVGACSGGCIVLANVVDRKVEWGKYSAQLMEPSRLAVCDGSHSDGFADDIEFTREHIIDFDLGFDHLVVFTASQCNICTLPDVHSPVIIDLKGPPSLLVMSETNFALVSAFAGVMVFSYDGRHLSSPCFQGLRPDKLSSDSLSTAPDALAIIDNTDHKIIRLFDPMTGRPIVDSMSEIKHEYGVYKVALSPHGTSRQDRRLVFIDAKQDLYICPTSHLLGLKRQVMVQKLSSQVQTFVWNESCNAICAVADSRLVTLWYPNAPFVDKDLLELANETQDGSEFGKSPKISSFNGATVTIRREDGATLSVAAPLFPAAIHGYMKSNKWQEAVRICRSVDNGYLWATLAGLALEHRELEAAEISLCALGLIDKARKIKSIRAMGTGVRQSAELLLYRRCPDEATHSLLQASPPLTYRAIKINIHLFRWERALEIAMKHGGSFVEIVLWHRQQFFSLFGKTEDDGRFRSLFDKYGELDQKRIARLEIQAEEDEKDS